MAAKDDFLIACKTGDAKNVDTILHLYGTPRGLNYEGETPLHVAAKHPEVVQALLNRCFSLVAPNRNGETALETIFQVSAESSDVVLNHLFTDRWYTWLGDVVFLRKFRTSQGQSLLDLTPHVECFAEIRRRLNVIGITRTAGDGGDGIYSDWSTNGAVSIATDSEDRAGDEDECKNISKVLWPLLPMQATSPVKATLLHCEVCKGKVSSAAKACPHCGHPIETADEPAFSDLSPIETAIVRDVINKFPALDSYFKRADSDTIGEFMNATRRAPYGGTDENAIGRHGTPPTEVRRPQRIGDACIDFVECEALKAAIQWEVNHGCVNRKYGPHVTPVNCCIKCGSKNIRLSDAGFSLGRAVGGALLAGPLGAVAGGMVGKKDTLYVCLRCGHKSRQCRRG